MGLVNENLTVGQVYDLAHKKWPKYRIRVSNGRVFVELRPVNGQICVKGSFWIEIDPAAPFAGVMTEKDTGHDEEIIVSTTYIMDWLK